MKLSKDKKEDLLMKLWGTIASPVGYLIAVLNGEKRGFKEWIKWFVKGIWSDKNGGKNA